MFRRRDAVMQSKRVEDVDHVIDLRFGVPGGCPTRGQHAVPIYIDLVARASRHECRRCAGEWWVSDAKPGVALPHAP